MRRSPGDCAVQPSGNHIGNQQRFKSPGLKSDFRSAERNRDALASAQALKAESVTGRLACHPLQKAPWPTLMNSQSGGALFEVPWFYR